MHAEIKQNFIKHLYKLSIYTAFIRLIWRHGQRGKNGPTSRSNTRYYEYILWRKEYTETLFEYVRNILPIKEENYKFLSVKGTARTFKANIKAKLQSEEDVAKFIENYTD